MNSVKWNLLFYQILIQCLIGLTIAQPHFRGLNCGGANYTRNSIYGRNLDTALSSITSNTNITYGFYNFSVGQDPDTRANAMALCRGDMNINQCRNCLNDSISLLRQNCPNQMEARGWYTENCFLRYSNRSIFGNLETEPPFMVLWGTVSDVYQFNLDLRTLLERIRVQAARGGSLRKFATGDERGPGFLTIYGLVECTPDLSERQCSGCLEAAANNIPGCCNGSIGAAIYTPSCMLSYDRIRFFNDSPSIAPPPPPPSPPPPDNEDNSTQTVIIIVIPTVTLVSLMVVMVFILIRKRKQNKPNGQFNKIKVEDESSSVESLQYNFDTIRHATNNFSDTNKLGQGGFGVVYKGRLQNGREIAVKRLSKKSGQGELEFKNEVLLMAKLQHRNLVRLLGFCVNGIERLLIYELVANASLDNFIFDPIKRVILKWEMRYKIIKRVARGLLYLHEESQLRIIHRDLKASNILLDSEMNPKISDFGMARLFAPEETHGNTKKIAGTLGYMPPEYALHGQFSVKLDVFSFGVLILEIVSGKKNCFQNGDDVEDLRSYTWKNWQNGTPSNVMDHTLRAGSGVIREITRCIHIGLLCVQKNVVDRPTMASVVLMFDSISVTLPVPSEPAFFVQNRINRAMELHGVYNSRGNEIDQSIDEDPITELHPR